MAERKEDPAAGCVSKYFAWPMDNSRPENQDKNIPDVILMGIWKQMIEEGKVGAVFYGGEVKTVGEWLGFIKSVGRFPVIVVDSEHNKAVTIAWFDQYSRGVAHAHFCVLGPYKKGIGETVINFWRGLETSPGAPFLKTMWGKTPDIYDNALRLIKILGFTVIGVIPNACWLHYEQKQAGGAISHLNLREEN